MFYVLTHISVHNMIIIEKCWGRDIAISDTAFTLYPLRYVLTSDCVCWPRCELLLCFNECTVAGVFEHSENSKHFQHFSQVNLLSGRQRHCCQWTVVAMLEKRPHSFSLGRYQF